MLTLEQQDLVTAIHANWDEATVSLTNQLAQLPDDHPVKVQAPPGSEAFKDIVAQNVLRTALEATLERMVPYAANTVVELGIRLLSYCVSAIPFESQDKALDEVVKVLHATHHERLAAGIHLNNTWILPGRDGPQPNLPGGVGQ